MRASFFLVVACFLAVGLEAAWVSRFNRTHGDIVCEGACQNAPVHHIGMNKVMPLKEVEFGYCRSAGLCPNNLAPVSDSGEKCKNGHLKIDLHLQEDGTGEYPCKDVDLLSYLPASALGSQHDTSDIWGVTLDIPKKGLGGKTEQKFVAIVCHADGTSFVDITSPKKPVILGFLETYDCGSASDLKCSKKRIWRDVKVYNGMAYIISENWGHGMQVFNITSLYDDDKLIQGHARVGAAPQTLTATYDYREFGHSHNIVLNEETGYAYVVGSSTCSGGLHVIDVDVFPPVFVGCFSEDGYTHDAQCVVYKDSYPDSRYHGKEICFAYNEDTLTIVDVEDKNNMYIISRTPYGGAQYTHQGWLLESGEFLILNDELDEQEGTTYQNTSAYLAMEDNKGHTRSLVWNVKDLQKPVWETSFSSEETAIDHNLYIRDGLAYETNYCAGLRVLNATDPLNMNEVAYFDVAPACSGTAFQGSWSNYPYYDHPDDVVGKVKVSQTVVVSSIERGLYVLRVRLPWKKVIG